MEIVRTDSVEKVRGADALRYNEGKPMWHLVDFDALLPMVRVLEYGAGKYAPNNWKKGQEFSKLTDCLQRHLNAFNACEDYDEESKQLHAGHIMANAMFLGYMVQFRPDCDDREPDPVKTEMPPGQPPALTLGEQFRRLVKLRGQ